MALVINNRVRETTSTTGTGAVTLGGAVGGFQTFAAGIGNDNTTYYAISINTENEWEVGLGTLNADSSTLTRTTVLESSNSDAAVDFAAGSKEVFCTLPSEKAVYLDASDNQVGGFSSLAADSSPQLGGDLDVNGNDIVSASAGNIDIVPDGAGVVRAKDVGGTTAAVKIAGTETIFVPAQAMFGTTTNGADAQAVETTAIRPELKVLDFDASTIEYAQFSIAMPKSWNLGTVTYQVFWSPGNTDTGNCIFGLQGVSCTEGDTADVVFGTAIEVTDAGIGTVEDVQMTAVSGAVTIGGSPADNDYTFFQLYRDAADGSDTFTGDARVMGIKLFYTTDAANDA